MLILVKQLLGGRILLPLGRAVVLNVEEGGRLRTLLLVSLLILFALTRVTATLAARVRSTLIAVRAHLNFKFSINNARNLILFNRLFNPANQLLLSMLKLTSLIHQHLGHLRCIALC